MKLNAPKNITFIVAVVLFVLGVLGTLAKVAFLAPFGVWLLVAAFVLLALGNLLSGL